MYLFSIERLELLVGPPSGGISRLVPWGEFAVRFIVYGEGVFSDRRLGRFTEVLWEPCKHVMSVFLHAGFHLSGFGVVHVNSQVLVFRAPQDVELAVDST